MREFLQLTITNLLRPKSIRKGSPKLYINELQTTWVKSSLHSGWGYWTTLLCKTGYFLRTCPIVYSGEEQHFIVTTSNFRRRFHLCVVGWLQIEIFILLFESKKHVHLEEVGVKEYVDFHIHAFTRALGTIITVAFCFLLDPGVRQLNAYLDLYQQMPVKFGRVAQNLNGNMKIKLDKLAKYVCIFFHIHPLIFPALLYKGNPQSYRYYHWRVLFGKYFDSVGSTMFVMFYEVYVSLLMFHSVYILIAVILIVCTCLMSFWTLTVKNIVIANKRRLFPQDKVVRLLYRTLQILTTISNKVWSILIPIIYGCGFVLILGVFVFFRGHVQKMQTHSFTSTISPLLMILLLAIGTSLTLTAYHIEMSTAATVTANSKLIKHQIEITFRKELRKVAVSFMDLRISIGIFQTHHESVTFAEFLQFVTEKIVTAFVVLK
ncbi:unnamed protein product [Orchesella dallaii]|uniref:Gustatory receptor n=1 Tax=Orchesella dallaii TaxID=48710 RepID=A0ABP1QLF1_9HEXA